MITAVEWLVEKWSIQGTLHSSDISQAKEMEVKQKELDYQCGYLDCYTKLMSENLTRKV